jgi:hypothetical protein
MSQSQKVDEARQRREGVTGGRAQKPAAAGKQKQETKGGGGGGGSGTGGGDVAELRAVASLLQVRSQLEIPLFSSFGNMRREAAPRNTESASIPLVSDCFPGVLSGSRVRSC